MDETSNPDSEFEYDTDSEKRSAKSKAKKRRYTQKYTTVWEKSHTWIKKSRISDSQFYCTVCHKNYICGTTEVLRHGKSTSHVKKAGEQKKQPNIIQVTSGICTEVRQIKEAELRISAFIAEHNLSFATADHLPKLIKTICPDSTIATKISCAREKCSGIIKNVLGDYRLNSLINELRKTKFSLLVDEATDIGGTKHLSLVVRIKESNGRVRDQFLTLLQISSGSANDMYNAIQQYFETNNINYKENMVGFAADGTNSMFGNNHSLCTLLKRDIPKLFTLTCVCHSFALCASYACKELPDGVEQLCREIYKYFRYSFKRYTEYKGFQEFCDVKPHKLLHPAQTRWLSLIAVVERVLEQWQALKLFFITEVIDNPSEHASYIHNKLQNDFNYLYLLFLQFVLPLFTNLNKEMQSEKPKLHRLYSAVKLIYKSILDMYMKSSHIENVELHKIQYKDPQFIKPIEDINLGGAVSVYLLRHQQIPLTEINRFRVSCLNFYIKSVSEINSRFSFDRKDLELMTAMAPEAIIKKSFKSITELAILLPNIIANNELNALEREWKLLPNTEFEYNPMEQNSFENYWETVARLKFTDDQPMFPLLTRIADCISIFPHSSAAVERIFSAININKTKMRNRLSTESVIGVLHTKQLFDSPATTSVNFPISNDLIQKMKSIVIYDHKKQV